MPLFQPADANTHVLSQFSLKGKIAAVTGGAKGIGLEVVRGLAEAGADVAIIYATTNAAEVGDKIAAENNVKIRTYQSDVRSRAAIAATVAQIVADFGRLDIMVANSGVCADIPNLVYTEETWQANNSVNFDGVMWTAQAAGKVFKEQGRGNLIITASVSATLVNVPQRQAAYNSSKAAAVHLAKSLAVEWVDFARVNCVSPGFIETESKDPCVVTTQARRWLTETLVLFVQPKERFDKWMDMIPGKRMAKAAELKSASSFPS
jgi:sorbose reductase